VERPILHRASPAIDRKQNIRYEWAGGERDKEYAQPSHRFCDLRKCGRQELVGKKARKLATPDTRQILLSSILSASWDIRSANG
jgi:hypothetical protein